MKIKENFVLRHVMDTDVLIDVTGAFSGIVKLNETSALITGGVAAGKSAATIAKELAERFEVTEERALDDVVQFCRAMCDEGVFSE